MAVRLYDAMTHHSIFVNMPNLVEQIREALTQTHRASLNRTQVLKYFTLLNQEKSLNEIIA
jgi:hypothetical protein